MQLRPDPLSEDQLVAMLRKRLQPIRSEKDKLRAPQLAVFLANEVWWYIAHVLGFPYAILAVFAAPLFHAIVFMAA